MGAALQSGNGSSGGRRARRRASRSVISDINVTPFVDVMLVLLIVFMVTAPLLTAGVPLELPQSKAKALEGDTEPLTISVTPEGKVFLQETEIPIDQLVPKLLAIAANGYDERVYVRGDQTADYGEVVKVMGELNKAGFNRIGLVTTPETVQK